MMPAYLRISAAIFACVAALTSGVAAGDDGSGPANPRRHTVTLEQVLEVTVQRSPGMLRRALLQGAADADATAANTTADTRVDGSFDVGASRSKVVQPANVPVLPSATDGLATTLRLTRELPWGTVVEVDGSFAVRRESYDADSRLTTYRATTRAGLMQPLLRGFGSYGATAERTRAAAHRDTVRSEQDLAGVETVHEVVVAYWELVYAVDTTKILRQALVLASEQREATVARVRAGQLPAQAIDEVDVAVTLREEALLVAQQDTSRRSMTLRRVVGLEVGPDSVDLVPLDVASTAVTAEPEVEVEIARALDGNPKIQVLRAQGRESAVDLEVARDRFLPRLDVSISAQIEGDDEASGLKAFSDIGQADRYDVKAGLVFSLPLGRTADSGRVQGAQHRVRLAKLEGAELRAEITQRAIEAVQALWLSRKRIEVLEKSEDFALRALRGERARFLAGQLSNFEVLRRQDQLVELRLRRARAQVDRMIAATNLDVVTGRLLASHGIALSTDQESRMRVRSQP